MDRERALRAVRTGAVAGTAVVYLAAVGMIEKFDTRNLIGSIFSLSRLLIVLPLLLAGYALGRPRIVGGERTSPPARTAVTGGLVAGLAGGALITLFIAVIDAIGPDSVRGVFVSITPIAFQILAFGHALGLGAAILLLLGAALAAGGASVRYLRPDIRRPVLVGLLAVVVFAVLQGLIPPAMLQLHIQTTWLYDAALGGLTYKGTVLVFVVATAVTAAWQRARPRLEQRMAALPDTGRKAVRRSGALVVLAILVILPWLLGSALSQILGTVGIYLLMGLGLNIVVGYAGLLDLGYVAFFATGAYLTAVLTAAANSGSHIHVGLSFYVALPIVVVVSALVGILIGGPVLRLRGDYLAIVTLGFGEIARVLVTSDALKSFLGGAQGLSNVPAAPIGGIQFSNPQPFYYLVLVFCIFAVFVSVRLSDSRIGRAWTAMREDEQVAEAMGISTTKYKLLAFATGAAFGSMAGALFAVQIGSLAPTSFNVLVSITVLALIILGGMGSIPGVVVGALVLIGLPQLLTEFEQYQLLLYGGALVGIMILRPQGLVPNVRRTRELLEEEREQDTWLQRAGEGAAEAPVAVGTARELE